jgi:hypothetical protein
MRRGFWPAAWLQINIYPVKRCKTSFRFPCEQIPYNAEWLVSIVITVLTIAQAPCRWRNLYHLLFPLAMIAREYAMGCLRHDLQLVSFSYIYSDRIAPC